MWNFGDGSPLVNETDPITTHIYTVAGSYTVTLTVTDSEGLTDTTSHTIMVGKPPVAVFAYSPDFPIVGESATFNASNSYDPNGYIVSYTWNFGDSNITTVTAPTITHVYAKEGNYTVALKVTDNEGLTGTTTLNIKVRNYPTAAFAYSPDRPVAGKDVAFDASSSSPRGGVIVSYRWNFGDGNITTVTNPIVVHRYSVGGNYTVTLTVTDSEGLSGSLSKIVRVRDPPVASFTHLPEPSYRGDVVTFNASGSYDTDGYIVSYGWNFGDGSPLVNETDPVTTHIYMVAGNYTAALTVTDNEGISSTITYRLTVLKAPLAIFTYSPDFPIVYEFIAFNASNSHDPNGYIANYTWNFGDGNITASTNPLIIHLYTKEGNYTIALTVTDNNGFTDIVVKMVRVRNYPTAKFTYSPNYPFVDETVTFDASQSTPNGGVIISYTWNFGDGNITTVFSAVIRHAFRIVGNYIVTLNVTDSEGLSHTTSKALSISRLGPKAYFTWYPSLPKPNQNVIFNASSSTPGWNGTYHFPIVSYAWDFGDGNITTVTEPIISHTYTAEGNYVVTLTVTDSTGLQDRRTRGVGVSYGREDINGDGKIDMQDIVLVILAFGTTEESPRWDPRCDVNLNGVVDMQDLVRVILRFGTTV